MWCLLGFRSVWPYGCCEAIVSIGIHGDLCAGLGVCHSRFCLACDGVGCVCGAVYWAFPPVLAVGGATACPMYFLVEAGSGVWSNDINLGWGDGRIVFVCVGCGYFGCFALDSAAGQSGLSASGLSLVVGDDF